MVGINQDFRGGHNFPQNAPGVDRSGDTAERNQRHRDAQTPTTKTVYDLEPGAQPYSTRDAQGNITKHEPRQTPQGGYEDHQTPGMDKGRVDADYFQRIKNAPGIRKNPTPETGIDDLVKGFVKDTFEDEDTGRLEAGRAIAAARSVAGRGQGSASGGMLAHAADVSMSAAERAQEKMFGRKLAVSGVAANLSRADLELSKMDENTRRNALAAIILGASGGMDPDQVQALVDAYENGDAQAQSIIADLWPKDGDEGKPDAVDDEEDGDSILTAPIEEQQSLWDQITGKKRDRRVM